MDDYADLDRMYEGMDISPSERRRHESALKKYGLPIALAGVAAALGSRTGEAPETVVAALTGFLGGKRQAMLDAQQQANIMREMQGRFLNQALPYASNPQGLLQGPGRAVGIDVNQGGPYPSKQDQLTAQAQQKYEQVTADTRREILFQTTKVKDPVQQSMAWSSLAKEAEKDGDSSMAATYRMISQRALVAGDESMALFQKGIAKYNTWREFVLSPEAAAIRDPEMQTVMFGGLRDEMKPDRSSSGGQPGGGVYMRGFKPSNQAEAYAYWSTIKDPTPEEQAYRDSFLGYYSKQQEFRREMTMDTRIWSAAERQIEQAQASGGPLEGPFKAMIRAAKDTTNVEYSLKAQQRYWQLRGDLMDRLVRGMTIARGDSAGASANPTVVGGTLEAGTRKHGF